MAMVTMCIVQDDVRHDNYQLISSSLASQAGNGDNMAILLL